jgi:tetratricopeptide (TPR) repeat protein
VTAMELRFASNTLDLFDSGRLAFPISYTNAQAAMYLIAFWPAIALAARRRTHVLLRSFGVGAATAVLAGWLLAQSKGAVIALVVSAVVFFALSPMRLRVLVPTLIPVALVAIASGPLTAPYRAGDDVVEQTAIQHGGTTMLWLTALGVAVGFVYAVADRRVTVSARTNRLLGIVALAAVAASLVAGVSAFLVTVDKPADFFADRWNALKHTPAGDPNSTHLLTLGSNRYDYWRVALGEFRDHPLAGDGARSFGPVYLQKRESPETPARAHSLPIEVLMEDGIVGFVLLCGAIGVPLALAARRARRRRVAAAAAFAGGLYWLVHALGDWIWTFPAAGVPFFVLLGIGASSGDEALLRRRKARPGAVAALIVALVAFTPVWLSATLTSRGTQTGSLNDLRWAERFDPLSVEPLVARALLAPTARDRILPLEKAIDKQPRSAAIQFLLGEAYLEADRRAEAVRALEEAERLDPRDPFIRRALRRARKRS